MRRALCFIVWIAWGQCSGRAGGRSGGRCIWVQGVTYIKYICIYIYIDIYRKIYIVVKENPRISSEISVDIYTLPTRSFVIICWWLFKVARSPRPPAGIPPTRLHIYSTLVHLLVNQYHTECWMGKHKHLNAIAYAENFRRFFYATRDRQHHQHQHHHYCDFFIITIIYVSTHSSSQGWANGKCVWWALKYTSMYICICVDGCAHIQANIYFLLLTIPSEEATKTYIAYPYIHKHIYEKAHKIHNVWPRGFYLMMPFLPPQPEIRVKFLTHDRTAAAVAASATTYQPSHQFGHPSVHPSTHPPIKISTHPPIHPSIHPYVAQHLH